ncbi:P2X purinoceptor 3a [Megalops cyprinoides]|uniref:P2X purinoceptor 3a n=1 Tax=Megalops cyprinoides TaxID=118141 RepID=UPI001864B674|nr:P2X purinoceptor 3a [Megalops cyprinoides]
MGSSKLVGCISDFFTYETTKSVVVKSWTIGIINRIVQLLIIIYFVGWVFLHERAYQQQDTAIESSVMTKVKGLGEYNNRVMDVAEYVIPPQGTSVFCIVTKLIATEQYQGTCHESSSHRPCKTARDCQRREPGDSGIKTHKCVSLNSTHKTCEIRGWCPAEEDEAKVDYMKEVENFTIFIKNSIRFPLFNFVKGNFLPSITDDYIKRCNFHPETDIYCPIFRVGDILNLANQSLPVIASQGGVIGIKIGWVCDLDKSADQCNPAYTFSRLDEVSQHNKVSKGYNFRYARYFMENGTERRTLFKAFAIRFDVLVYGSARKFYIVPTLINIVVAFTSVGVGTVLCDIILLNFLKGADQYKAKKFEEVSETQITSSVSQSNELCEGSQMSIKQTEKQSDDSGAYSIGQLA